MKSETLLWLFMENTICRRAQSLHERRMSWESGGPEFRSRLPCSVVLWRGGTSEPSNAVFLFVKWLSFLTDQVRTLL